MLRLHWDQIPFFVLLAFVFLLPLEHVFIDKALGSITRIVGLGLFPLAMGKVFLSGRSRCLTRSFVLLSTFVGICLFSRAVIAGEGVANVRLLTLVQLYALSWVLWELMTSRRHFDALLHGYLLGALVLGLAVLANALTLGPIVKGEEVRVGAFGANLNRVGLLSGMAIPVLAYLFQVHRRLLYRGALLAVLPLLVYAVLATGSRGALVATLGGLLPALEAFRRRSPSRALLAALIGGFVLVLGFTQLPEYTQQRLLSTGEMLGRLQFNYREQIWVAGLEQFSQSPVIGVGWGNFEASVAWDLLEGVTAHNTFVAILVESGVLGFAAFLLFLTRLTLVSSDDGDYLALRRSLILFWVLASLTTGLEGDKLTWFVFGMLGGAGSVRLNEAQEEEASPPGASPPGPRGPVPLPSRWVTQQESSSSTLRQ